MSYWTVIAVLIAAAYLLLRHPLMSWNFLPQWLLPSDPKIGDRIEETSNSKATDEQHSMNVPTVVTHEALESESTPKAMPAKPATDVPTFSLGDDDHQQKTLSMKVEAKPSFPAVDSPQKVSSMLPPPKPQSNGNSRRTSSLTPPPGRGPIVQRAPPASAAASLRVPSNGPLPNRGPPSNSQQRANGGLSVNGAVTTPNSRGKVLLSPGHSPMDWAALTRSGNLAGVSTFQRVTPSQLRSMTGRKGKPAWSSWQGKVYNITPYLPFHPGGESELMKAAGRDGTKLFMEYHPWVNWENMLGTCLVGVLVPEDYAQSSLEDMD